jgi:hypothetical protein
MAYSSSFLDLRNNNNNQRTDLNADNSSSNYLDLENNLKFEEREIIHNALTRPIQRKKNDVQVAKRKKKKPIRSITEVEQENKYQDMMFKSPN